MFQNTNQMLSGLFRHPMNCGAGHLMAISLNSLESPALSDRKTRRQKKFPHRGKEVREVRGRLAIEGFFQGDEFVAPGRVPLENPRESKRIFNLSPKTL